MEDARNPCQVSSSHRRRRSAEAGDPTAVACSWKSCAAEVIADCVAICCCPCGIVSILVLAFVKLPWAVARRCFRRRRRRRKLSEGNRERRMVDMETAAEEGNPSVRVDERRVNDDFTPEVGRHVGGALRVPTHSKGN